MASHSENRQKRPPHRRRLCRAPHRRWIDKRQIVSAPTSESDIIHAEPSEAEKTPQSARTYAYGGANAGLSPWRPLIDFSGCE